MNIGIVGLGLIGGSLAKAFRGKEGIEKIYAFNRSSKAIDAALCEGVIDIGTSNDYSIFEDCAVVFICVPVGRIIEEVQRTAQYCKGIITDAGSTKTGVMKKIQGKGLRFVGGHPMAGSERSGYFASNAALFENAVYVICPEVDSDKRDIELLKDLASLIGALPLVMDAAKHDRITATVSHIPHIEASALCLLAEKEGEDARRLAAGGFRDMTRIASGSTEMWVDIALDASDTIAPVLERHIKSLQEIQMVIRNKDKDYLASFFARAKEFRDSLPAKAKGAVQSMPQLLLEVPDKPGVLGEVATILGNAGINIKDISIQNIREYEGGTLRITLQDPYCASKAFDVLTRHGYECKVV